MKNIHLLPTTQPSRLHLWTDENGTRLELCELKYSHTRNTQNIYITDRNYEFNQGWYFNNSPAINKAVFVDNEVLKGLKAIYGNTPSHLEKIVITNDKDLIADLVQHIDSTFLEWFVNNQSCESIEIGKENICARCNSNDLNDCWSAKECSDGKFDKIKYKIIIPKEEQKELRRKLLTLIESLEQEELKQETLEDAAEKYAEPFDNRFWVTATFIEGAKWQQEQDKNKYSEEEVLNLVDNLFHKYSSDFRVSAKIDAKEWFEQFKK